MQFEVGYSHAETLICGQQEYLGISYACDCTIFKFIEFDVLIWLYSLIYNALECFCFLFFSFRVFPTALNLVSFHF